MAKPASIFSRQSLPARLCRLFYRASVFALKHYRVFFTLQILVIMTTKTLMTIINPECDISGGDHPYLTFLITFLLAIADTFFICLLASGCRKLRLPIIGSLLVFLSLLIAIAELYTMAIYHSVFTRSVVQLFLETNLRESSEMASSILGNTTCWIVTLLLLAYWGLAVIIARKMELLSQWLMMGTVTFCLLCLAVQSHSFVKLYRSFTMEKVTDMQRVKSLPFMHTPLVRFLFGVACYRVSTGEIQLMKRSLEETQVDSCSFRSPIIILVIGESHAKAHSSIYNPEGPETMPNMHRRQETGHLVAFDNAISVSNVTSMSFNEMFSTMNDCTTHPQEGSDWTEHSLFPAVFRKAGYRVYFMSNQFILDVKEFWSSLGGGPLTEKSVSPLLFDRRNGEVYPYDHQLLNCPEFPCHDQMTSSPSLLIVHLMGEHVEYHMRHTPEFNAFNRDNVCPCIDSPSAREVMAEYYNSLTYTDALLDSLLSWFDHDEAVCIYLSDHGEELYDWRDFYNRSHEKPVLPQVARYQYEIPLFIHMTDTYKARHADITENALNNVHKPFVSRYLPDLLFGLAGIYYKDYEERFDLLSPNYDTQLKRIINSDEDYDALISRLK